MTKAKQETVADLASSAGNTNPNRCLHLFPVPWCVPEKTGIWIFKLDFRYFTEIDTMPKGFLFLSTLSLSIQSLSLAHTMGCFGFVYFFNRRLF